MMFLTAQEIRELTGRQRVTAQARALDSMGIPYRKRPDDTLAVLRAAVEAILGGGVLTPTVEPAIPEPQLILRNDSDGKARPWDIAKGRRKREPK